MDVKFKIKSFIFFFKISFYDLKKWYYKRIDSLLNNKLVLIKETLKVRGFKMNEIKSSIIKAKECFEKKEFENLIL